MARWDARYFYMDWRYFAEIDRDFWDLCLDEEGKVRAEYRCWLQEEIGSADLVNWKVAREACELYEILRGKLSPADRKQADTLFSQLFGFADFDYWPGFAGWEYTLEEQDWLKKSDVNHLLSPQKIKEILPLWREELAVAIMQVFGTRPQDTYINCWEAFLSYMAGWLELLERVEKLGGWWLLVLLY